MAYNWNVPAYGAPIVSQEIRDALQAISTFHKGPTEPSSKQGGFTWIDDSNASNWILKIYNGTAWTTVMEHVESSPVFGRLDSPSQDSDVDFYEGAVPPPAVNIDNYDFEDAAGFNPSVNEDIILIIVPHDRYSNGLKLRLRYCMSTAQVAQVKLRLNYRVKSLGDNISLGTDYVTEQVITVTPNADIIAFNEEVQIPAGRIDGTKEAVHCRLTRVGSDVADTHGGIFCVFGLLPKPKV